MTKILLVRHGYSLSNKDNTFTGQLDIPLSELGKKQAELCSDYILKNYKIDAIYSSDLSRAIDTVKKVADTLNLPIQICKEFREVYGGEWEGMEAAEISKKYPKLQSAWANDVGRCRCPNGESLIETGERAYKKLTEIAKKEAGKTIIVATHAGAIRAMECIIRKIAPQEMQKVAWVSNASITELEYDEKGFSEKKISFDEYLNDLKTKITVFK